MSDGSTNAIALLREQAGISHWLLEATMADVTPEQAQWTPPGIANPLGATYAHLVCSEDMIVNGMLRQQAPLAFSSWAGKTGLSEPQPTPEAWDKYPAWTRSVQVDLGALREYAQAVYAATDEYLATLKDDDLGRKLDLSAMHLGEQTLGWALTVFIVSHAGTETGEVATLKGIQGAKGYPF